TSGRRSRPDGRAGAHPLLPAGGLGGPPPLPRRPPGTPRAGRGPPATRRVLRLPAPRGGWGRRPSWPPFPPPRPRRRPPPPWAAAEGRTAHRFALDWRRFRIRAGRHGGGRAVTLEGEPVRWDGELAVRWDHDGAELHRGRVRGPARVQINVPSSLGEGGDAVVVCSGTVLEVRP